MSFNKKVISKRGGRFKNNFIDNGNSRRSNTEQHTMAYSSQCRPATKSFNTDTNNIQNISNFYDDPTTLYLLCKYYLGNFVCIKTDTEELNGVLKAVSPNGDFCLTEATVFTHNVEFISKNEKFKMIPIKEIKVVEVRNVDADYNMFSSQSDRIPTDEEISKLHRSKHGDDTNYNENGSQDVELTPFYDGTTPCEDNCLNANKVGAHWFPPEEMFEKNKMRFNVQSSFSEDLEGYTTKLHKEDPNFTKDLMMAHKKAQEIEKNRDHNFNDLENDDERNEESLFCSVSRCTELPHIAAAATLNNKMKSSDISPRSQSDNFLSSQELNDAKHNLNPNAREFTPISSASSHFDAYNASVHINSLNLQPQGPFANFVHPSNMMPYPVSVMFPPHHPNNMPIMHNPAMDQYLIQRPNFLPNYPMSSFMLPNQCQIAFEPSMNVMYSSPHDSAVDRENGHNEGSENSHVTEEMIKEDAKFGDETERDEVDNTHEVSFNLTGDSNCESSECSNSFQKMTPAHSSQNQRVYSQVMAGNSQAYIFPANVAHGIRHAGNQLITNQIMPNQMIPNQMIPNQMMPNQIIPNQMMPNQIIPNQMMPNQMMPNQMMPNQMMPNQMSYMPNYFSRQAQIVAPLHQISGQHFPFQMKQISAPNGNFQSAYQPNPSFVPLINPMGGPNFQAFLPSFPSSMQAPVGAQIQIPIHANMGPFPQFIAPLQHCNYFTPTQPPPQCHPSSQQQ